MTLDLPTLLIVSPLIVVSCCVLYLTGTARRRGMDKVDRCWTLTFVALLMVTVCYLLSGLNEVAWVANGLGNGLFVLALGAMWSGVRAFDGRRPYLWIVVVTAVVAGASALALGPDGGVWAGGEVYLVGLTGWSLASAVAILRGRVRAFPSMTALAVVAAGYGLFTAARTVIALTRGFDDELFLTWAGSEVATLIGVLVAVVGSFAMITVRAPGVAAEDDGERRFDPHLGLRTPAWLAQRADVAVDRVHEVGLASTVVLVRVRDLDEIESAFGRQLAREAFERTAEEIVAGVPRDVLAGTVDHLPATIVVIAPGTEGAAAVRLVRLLEGYLRGMSITDDDLELPLVADLAVATGDRSWRRLVTEAAAAADEAQLSRSTT